MLQTFQFVCVVVTFPITTQTQINTAMVEKKKKVLSMFFPVLVCFVSKTELACF